MKRGLSFGIGLVLLCLLALAACGGNGAANDISADPALEVSRLRMEGAELRPIVRGGELSGARYPMEEGTIFAVANGFSLDILFSDALDPEQIPGAVQIRGPSEVEFTVGLPDTSVTNYDRIINVRAPSVPPGRYQLAIASGITGIRALALEESVFITIDLDSQTEGAFFLLDSSGFPRPISYEESRYGLSLSDTDKTFIIHFDQDVNQTSVQDSLIAGLREQPVIASFSWLTPRQLRVNLAQLQAGISYTLVLDRGIDLMGNGILGSCIFRAGKASNVGVIQLATGEMTMIYQFSEERYSGIRSQSVYNRVLLQAGSSLTWSFGLGTRQLYSLPSLRYDLALPQNYREPIWVGYDHLLGYHNLDKTINLVSVAEGTVEYLYTLPERPIECRLSPNGRLLAVVYKAAPDNRMADLLLIDLQYLVAVRHVPDFTRPYTTSTGLSAVNLTWSSDDSFLYADNDDILRAYLSADGKVMDRANTIERDARILDYSIEKELLLYKPSKSGGDDLYLVQDNRTKRLRGISPDAPNFYCVLVDEETILYQDGEEIYQYDTNTQASTLLGSGLLLGLSANRDRAYYMINAEDYSRVSP